MRTTGEPALLLLDSLGRRDGATARDGVPSLTSDQWTALVDDAIRHGLAPLLYRRLEGELGRAPPSVARRLHDIYLHAVLRHATLREQLAAALAALHGAGIPVIALKGAHLAEGVYDDPAVRPMTDIDLMVRQSELASAERVLLELGYERGTEGAAAPDYADHHHTRPFEAPGAIPVELHRSLGDRRGPAGIDVEGLWERAAATRIAGAPALALAPEDLLLHLCVHAAYNHRFEVPVLAVYDVVATIERHADRLDWHRLAGVANQVGAGRLVYGTLRLAVEMFGVELPTAATERLGHDASDRHVAAAACAYILAEPRDVPVAYQRLGEQTSVAGRARVLARTLFPPLEELRRIYRLPRGSRAAYAFYALRPLDLLVRRGRTMLAILAGTERLRPAIEREAQRRLIERWLRSIEATARRPYRARIDSRVSSTTVPRDRA